MLNEKQKESSFKSTSSSPSSSCTTKIDNLSNPESHPIKELKHESQAKSDEVQGQDSCQEKESSNFIGVTFEGKRDEEEYTGSDEYKRQRKRKEIPQRILLLHQKKRQESNDVIRHEDEEKPFLHQQEATKDNDCREDYNDDAKNQLVLESSKRMKNKKEMLHKSDYPDSPGASNRSIKSSIDIEANEAVNGDHHQVKRHACNSRDRFLSSSTPSRTISIESNLKDTPDEKREESSRGTNNNLKHQKSLDSNHKFQGPKNRVSSSIGTTGAPDGGWGWVVVFASFMISLVADGISFSFGIIFLELSTYFNESKSKTAFVGSLFMSIPLLVGPLASALTEKYGCRKITIVSGLVSCTGFIIGTFATSIEHLFIAFSVAGAGLALSYVTSIVIVAYYFEKKRSLATGLAVCGTGFGTFIFAPLTIYLMEKYGWRGTLLIMSGFFLNIVVFGALMRDLPDDDEDDDEEEESDAVESDTDSSQSNDHRSLSKHLSNNKSSMRQNNALSLEAGSFLFPTNVTSNEVNKSSNMFTSFFQRQTSHQPSCSTPFASSFKDSSNNNTSNNPLHDVLKSFEGHKNSTATATSPRNNNNTLRTSSSLIHIPTFLTSHRGSFSLDDQQVSIINELSVKKGGVLSRLIQRYPNMLSTFFSSPTHQGIPTSSNHFHPSHPLNNFHPRRTDSSRVSRPAPSLLPASEIDMTPNHEPSPSSLYSSPNTYGNNNNSSSINNNNVTCVRVDTSSTPAPKGVSIRSPLSSNHTLSFKSPTKLNEPRTVIGKRLSVNPMIVTGYRLNSLIPFEHGSQARKLQRGSITYRSAMLNIHRRHRLRSSSCPDMTVAVVGSFTPSASVQKRKQTWREELKEFLNDIIDVSIFRSIKYSLFCFSNLLLYACIDVPYVYIPDHAITSGSSTKEEASFLISLIGMVNTAGIVLVGYIGDKPWLEPTHLYSGLICCSGISVGLIPLLSSYTSLAILSALYGLTISANYALVSVILVDLISLDKFTIGYGLLLMVQGIASLIGPPFAGYLCDLTGTYDVTFYVTGVCIFISGAVVLPVANSPLCSLLCPEDSLTKNMIPVPTVDVEEEEEVETECDAKVHVQMDEDFQEIVL